MNEKSAPKIDPYTLLPVLDAALSAMNPLERGVHIAGGNHKFGQRLGTSLSTANFWRNRGFIPPGMALSVEDAFFGWIPAEEILIWCEQVQYDSFPGKTAWQVLVERREERASRANGEA